MEAPLQKSGRGKWGRILGYLVASACLVWVFHDIHFEQLARSVAAINWWWILPAVACDILGYFSQGMQWHFLLRPVGSISVVRTTQAIYAGLFTNEIIPMRMGELVRTFLVSRWMSKKFVSIVPSLVVGRFFEAAWLGVGIGLTASLVHLPKNLSVSADVLGVAVLIVTVSFVYLFVRKKSGASHSQLQKTTGWKPLRLLSDFIRRLTAGISDIGASPALYFALLTTALILTFEIFAFWFVMRAYGLHVSVWAGAAVFLIVHLGTAIPNAPSNVGTFQFFTVLGLTLFGIDKTAATGFSVVVFLVLTIPLWLIGFWAISRTGLTLGQIRNEMRDVMRGGSNEERKQPQAEAN